jgi:hypothetical protein
MKRLSLSLTFVLVVLSSLQAAETVRTAWDHETDFSALKTYGWMGGQQPLPNEANHIRVTEAIERAMERKGFQKAAFEDAQVLLLYRAGIQQQVGVQSYQTVSTYDPTAVKTMMDFHREKRGTLTVEMFDGATRKIIWRAEGSNVLPKPDKMEKAIGKAVHSLLRHYPPGSTPDPPLP